MLVGVSGADEVILDASVNEVRSKLIPEEHQLQKCQKKGARDSGTQAGAA